MLFFQLFEFYKYLYDRKKFTTLIYIKFQTLFVTICCLIDKRIQKIKKKNVLIYISDEINTI